MTPDGVYENEMAPPTRTSASDEEWPAGDPTLASFAEDLRVVASGPAPEPRPGLLAVMRQGPTVPIDSPHPTGRKKMLVKTLLGSLAAKVALGTGVAAASMTAAGAAGVLPAPAQEAVASIVAATTPFALPDPSDVSLQVVDDPSSTTTTTISTSTTLAGGDDGEGDEDGTAGRKVNHGACVSAAARDKAESEPGSHGRTVSSIARGDCGKDATGTTSTTVASSTTTSSTSTTVDGERTANSGPGSANRGRGDGGNRGNGNSGNGGNRGNSGRN